VRADSTALHMSGFCVVARAQGMACNAPHDCHSCWLVLPGWAASAAHTQPQLFTLSTPSAPTTPVAEPRLTSAGAAFWGGATRGWGEVWLGWKAVPCNTARWSNSLMPSEKLCPQLVSLGAATLTNMYGAASRWALLQKVAPTPF